MVSLADIFNNVKTKVQNNELYNKLLGQELVKELPQIKPVQMREDGSMYEIEQPIEKKPTLMQRAVNSGDDFLRQRGDLGFKINYYGDKVHNAINNIGSKLGNYLLGEQEITTTQDEPIKDENGNLIPSNTISATPRRGGVLRDIAEGYRENRNTPFSIDNLGGRKTFANRIGEAVGSVSRFADSPLGRGLIMAGIVGATGGGALPALAFGSSTSLMNQQNRAKDQLYRNALKQQGVDTSNIKGYVTDDPFENYTLANYRNRNLDVKMHLGTLNDNTKRAKLINTMLNTGELNPIQAAQLLGDYGIDVTELDTSNQTKLLPYKQFAIQTNAASNAKRANAYANYMSDRTINNETVNADLAEYLEIVNSNNRDQIEYARNSFIKRYGKDPDKLIKM